MKGPKILIEIPPGVNHKIMAYQALMEDLRLPIPTKRELITALLVNGQEWLDKKIKTANDVIDALSKV